MTKSGALKPVLLLALIAVVVIALAEPIAGDMMDQGSMMDRQSTMIVCPDNQTCSVKISGTGDHPANDTMMHCMMGDQSMNDTMMHCMMGNDSMNDTMMHHCMHHCMHCMMGNNSMMGNHSMNDTMMHCMMGADSMNDTGMHGMMGNQSMNDTMMHCMMGNHSMNGSCCMMEMDQNASEAQVRLDCAKYWLEKAIELHEVHLNDPSTATNESQTEMMDQMMKAYECIVGENVTENTTMEITNTTADHGSQGH